MRNARGDLKARAGVVALHAGLIALVWVLGFLPDVLAGGLAVIAVVSGVVPDRWSAITAGVLLLAGAGLIYVNYSQSGDRRLALVAAILGIVFVGYGAMRMRSRGPS